jgi:hypothetical protein
MTLAAWPRRLALAATLATPFFLAACSSDEKARSYPKLSFDYMTKLRLNVASIDIDDTNPPVRDPKDMSILAPNKPADALRQMARDRLIPTASSGHAVFVVDEASIVPDRDKLKGSLAVHLDITTSDGNRTGYAEARVSRTADYENDAPNATRATLDKLVNNLMKDMNVEFEYQIRRSLHAYLQSGEAPPPAAKPVQSEELAPVTPKP